MNLITRIFGVRQNTAKLKEYEIKLSVKLKHTEFELIFRHTNFEELRNNVRAMLKSVEDRIDSKSEFIKINDAIFRSDVLISCLITY